MSKRVDPVTETREEALARLQHEVGTGRHSEIKDFILEFAILHTTDEALRQLLQLADDRITHEGYEDTYEDEV